MAYINGQYIFTEEEHFPMFFQEVHKRMRQQEAAKELDLAYQQECLAKGGSIIGNNAMQYEAVIQDYLNEEKIKDKYKISKKAEEKAIDFIKTVHDGDDGFITIFQKENRFDKEKKAFIMIKKSHLHYTIEEIEELELRNIITNKNNDVYCSVNSFYKARRSAETLRKINALYLDVDNHNVSRVTKADIERILKHYQNKVWGKILPEPSIIVSSGRGIQLYWCLENLSKHGLAFWQLLEDRFLKELKEFDAFGFNVDSSTTDVTRVFRLVGTNHSIARLQAKILSQDTARYRLDQLVVDYFPDLILDRNKSSKTKKIVTVKPNKEFKEIQFKKNIYTLHYSRLQDIKTLQHIRNYNCKGKRELMCFLFRYYSCLFTKDIEIALEDTLEFNSKFTEPLAEKEVINETRSAEEAFKEWEEQNNAILNGETVASTKNKTRKGYNYKNTTLIKLLDITPEEQTQLSTIISKEEANSREKAKKKEARRNEEGLTPKQQELKNLKEQALMLREQGLNNTQIAKELNIHRTKVIRALAVE